MTYRVSWDYGVLGVQRCFVIGENLRKQALSKNFNTVIREKESQIQDLWNRESKFNPIQDGLFWGCSGMVGGQNGSPSLKSVTHILQWWNLAKLYLTERRSKKYVNHVTYPLSSVHTSIFSPEISQFCYIKKYR